MTKNCLKCGKAFDEKTIDDPAATSILLVQIVGKNGRLMP